MKIIEAEGIEVAEGMERTTIVLRKQTEDYRILTDDPDNWRLLANRAIAAGEPIVRESDAYHISVGDQEFVDLILEETGERKRIYTAISAVPSDSGCGQTALEIPFCLMNHSCEPNTHDRWNTKEPADLALAETEAVRGIREGEELTYDYDLEQYDYGHPFRCECGTTACRGTIRGFGSLDSDRQQKMFSSASPFLQERHRREFAMTHAEMATNGRHLLVDYWNCDAEKLNDEVALVELLSRSAQAAGANVMSVHSHRFPGQGVTAVAILSESHISIHTWPGSRYAGVDFYTCGNCDPLEAHQVMKQGILAGRADLSEIERGDENEAHSMKRTEEKNSCLTGLTEDRSWFFEGAIPGRREGNISHGFRVDEVVLEECSAFQDYLIFDSPLFGRVLVLDGVVQLSTSDEHIYHEMLVHPPMFTHRKPRRVLIVGGGDGGTLREVLQHDPEEVVMIDIDEQFVRSIAEHLPTLHAGAFDDPRVTLLFEDAFEALKRYENAFDVAIIDCNDDLGPSEPLFTEEFYAMVGRALTGEGICSVQAGSMLDSELLERTKQRMGNHLGSITGFRLTMPIYHCGEYVFFVASKASDPKGPDPESLSKLQERRDITTRHWSPDMHHASQVLPPQSTLW